MLPFSYEELKGWQTAIGSVLGFVALIAGALWNFHLNRKRDAFLRKEETHSIAAALYGEIILLRHEAASLARAVAKVHIDVGTRRDPITKFDRHFVEAHTLSEPLLYKALASRIGLLEAELIIAITEFHKNYQQAKVWLPLLIENSERKYNCSCLSVLVPASSAVKDIIPALRKIEIMISLPTPAKDPDLGAAEDVIEMEELLWKG